MLLLEPELVEAAVDGRQRAPVGVVLALVVGEVAALALDRVAGLAENAQKIGELNMSPDLLRTLLAK